MSEGNQVRDETSFVKRLAHILTADYSTTSVVTKMCVRGRIQSRGHFMDLQITCLYDMDIVFRPDGNFDEVYLYVRMW